jgi:hypothetical protein
MNHLPKRYPVSSGESSGRYSGAAADIANYSTSAVASSEFIEPHLHYNKQIQYPQMYEELKAMILV